MSTMTIRMTMEKIIDMPIIFLLVTVILFLVVVAVITAVGYTIACAQSKKTEMTGIMRVGVTLNDWYDASQYKDVSVLHYGDFWIGMKDPETVDGERLDAALNWKEKAFCRQYKVCLMLKRFLTAYKAAGLTEDPSAQLLEELLNKEDFCNALGACCYRSEKKGLAVADSVGCKMGSNKDKVSVYIRIDDSAYAAATGAYAAATGCGVQTICITLEYRK